MTRTFSVNSNNDLFIGKDGNLSISVGLDAVTQACEQAAKTQLGEVVIQTSRGIPNKEVIWVGVPIISQFVASLRAALRDVADVTDVPSIITNQNGDVLEYIAVINTIYGQQVISNGG